MGIDVFRKVGYEFEKKRRKALEEAEYKKEKIYTLIPRLKEIQDEIRIKSIGITKIFIHNKGNFAESISKLKEEITVLKEEKNQLLKSHSLYEEDFLPNFECKLCNDTGYIENGSKCVCFKQKLAEEYFNMSGIFSSIKDNTFENFNFDLFKNQTKINQGLSVIDNINYNYSICKAFCENFDFSTKKDGNCNLLLFGATGVGKTYMCNCITNEMLKKGKLIIYQMPSQMMEYIENYKFKKNSNYTDLKSFYDYLYECDLLIIDDLGTELNTSFTNSELFNLLNSRLLANKKTIISTNLSITDITNIYSMRISSRLLENYELLYFFGDDLRIKKL